MRAGKVIITTSWDDGDPFDIKLCKILRDKKIASTIYTPLTNHQKIVINSDEIKKISENFEIGSHTYNHTVLTRITHELVEKELSDSKNALEKIIQKDVTSFCYPLGKYSADIIKDVKKAGFKCGRTAELFRASFNNPYELHTTVQATDRILLSKAKQIAMTDNRELAVRLLLSGNIFKKWNIIAKETFDYILEMGGIWHLWGHSWEVERNNEWELLRDVLEYVSVKGRDHGAEFLTNGELVMAT